MGKTFLFAVFGLLTLFCVEVHAMKTFYVVEAGGSRKPLFPDSCVICGMPGTERLVSIILADEWSRVEFFFYNFPAGRLKDHNWRCLSMIPGRKELEILS